MTSSFNTPHELERHEGEHSMPLGLAIFGESRRRKRSVLFALICLGLAPVAFTTAALPSMIGPGAAV